MARKNYSPVASYEQLKLTETMIDKAETAVHIRDATKQYGAKIGYKAFCYILMGKMTPEGMKPDEAAVTAVTLEAAGETDKAQEIYGRILAAHPDHVLAKQNKTTANS